MVSVSGSVIRLKISGDSGQPCLVSFVKVKGLDSRLEVYTWAEGDKYNANMAQSRGP